MTKEFRETDGQPTTSSHFAPISFDAKNNYRLIRNADETIMVDTVTTDSNSSSSMGGGGAKRDEEGAGGGARHAPFEGVEWSKAVFLFVFLFAAGVSNWAVIAYTHDFVPRDPLPDVLFALVPEQRWASSLGDFCVALCILILAGLLSVHQHRATILKRVVFCAATLYSMRSVTLAVTQLPSGYTDNTARCRERVAPRFAVFVSRLVEQTIRIGFQSKESMLCGDLLFSGHTLVMVTCSLAVAYYLPRSIKWVQWVSHVSCLVGMTCMVVSRTHYTIDVVIAYWLSNMVFRIYHAYCELDVCMERQKSILFSWWPCRVVDWLEENIVPGRLENRCRWPFGATWKRHDEDVESSEASSSHQKHVSISSTSTYPLPC